MDENLTGLVPILRSMEDRLTELEGWSAAFMAVGDSQGDIPAEGVTVMRDAMDVEIVALRTAWREAWSLLHDPERQPATEARAEPPTGLLAIFLHTWRLRRIRRAMRALQNGVNAYEAAYGKPPFTPADPQA